MQAMHRQNLGERIWWLMQLPPAVMLLISYSEWHKSLKHLEILHNLWVVCTTHVGREPSCKCSSTSENTNWNVPGNPEAEASSPQITVDEGWFFLSCGF